MYKINKYLLLSSFKYIFINMILISILIIFFNLIEISRILNYDQNNILNYTKLTFLKLPSILNETLPFVIIISIAFLFRNLINNNELISMRNVGYSIFDIFIPISLGVLTIGLFFLLVLNPIASKFEIEFEKIIKNKDPNLYSIKISNKGMWIKNQVNSKSTSYIITKNMNLKTLEAKDINLLVIDEEKKFIRAKNGIIKDDYFVLKDVQLYNIENEEFVKLDIYKHKINFNRSNLLNSITNYKQIPFYKYWSHSKTLKKFNLYSSEIGLHYLSEIFKPFFIVLLSFLIVGFSGKFRRNENFFKVLFTSILIGFLVFLLKEVVTKLSITLNINFILSFMIIFIVPCLIGIYQFINIENE